MLTIYIYLIYIKLIKINQNFISVLNIKEYKTIHKYKAFIKLNEKEKIINFLNVHNHLDNEIKAIHEETRKEIVKEI